MRPATVFHTRKMQKCGLLLTPSLKEGKYMQTMTLKNLAILCLTAAMTLGSGAALAATASSSSDTGSTSSNGQENQSNSPGATQNLPPNNVDSSKINTSTTDNSNMTADQIDKNTKCKDGKCPDINSKVQTGKGATPGGTKTDGTTQ